MSQRAARIVFRIMSVVGLLLAALNYLMLHSMADGYDAQVQQVQAKWGDLAYLAPPDTAPAAHAVALVVILAALIGVAAAFATRKD